MTDETLSQHIRRIIQEKKNLDVHDPLFEFPTQKATAEPTQEPTPEPIDAVLAKYGVAVQKGNPQPKPKTVDEAIDQLLKKHGQNT